MSLVMTMPQTPTSAAAAHRVSLEHVQYRQAKADLKKVELPSWAERIGLAVARAFALAGLSQKEVAGLIGRDVAQVSRWCKGTERPQFDALFAADALRTPLVLALAALSEDVECETTLHIRRRTA